MIFTGFKRGNKSFVVIYYLLKNIVVEGKRVRKVLEIGGGMVSLCWGFG